MTLFCFHQSEPVWQSGIFLAQDPRGIPPVQDYRVQYPKAKEIGFNHDLNSQEALHLLLQAQREVLRYETCLSVSAFALRAIVEAHNSLLHYICLPFDRVINENYEKGHNKDMIWLQRNSPIVTKLRTATAALAYYAADTARNKIQNDLNTLYGHVAAQLRTTSPIHFPYLSETLRLKFVLTSDAQERVQQILAKNHSFLRTKEQHENQNKHLLPPTATLIADKSPIPPVSLLEMATNIQTATPSSETKQRSRSRSTPLKATPSNVTKVATSTVSNILSRCQLPLITVNTNLLTVPPSNKRLFSVDNQDNSRSKRRCQSDFTGNPQTYPVLRRKRKSCHQHRALQGEHSSSPVRELLHTVTSTSNTRNPRHHKSVAEGAPTGPK